MTLEEVVARLDEFSGEHTVYAEAPKPGACAVVTSDDGRTDLAYLLEVGLAREATSGGSGGRAGRRHSPTRSPR